MSRTICLARLIPALLLPAMVLPALAQSAPSPAAAHLAGLLTNDARDTLRNPALPPDAAAVEASILLECAVQLDGSDLRTLHLLAQAAQAAGRTDAQRDALRKIITADAGDFRAQVEYIDLLAAASQTAEDRMATYRGALGKSDLDAQVRSEIALRLARLAEGRGDLAACRDYLGQSVALNSVNIGALRDQVRLAAAEPPGPDAFNRHVQSLVGLLVANPYQADAWLQAGRLCEAASIHDRAASFLQTAVEQSQIDGSPLTLDQLLEMTIELAVADRRSEAYAAASGLSQLPDAPLAMLLVAQVLSEDGAAAPARASGTQPLDRAAEIHKRLTELAKQTDDPAALADAAGASLTTFSDPGSEVAGWIEAYAKLVKPEDTTLARLKGWLAYRQNNLDAAQTALTDAADKDPLAKVGLARTLLAQGHADQAGKLLQDLWDANPTGLLALQISLAANKGNIKLTDSPTARTVRPLLARLTPQLSTMYRQPIDTVLISTNYRKPAVGPGEPEMLQVRMSNTTDRPIPVGSNGIVKPMVGLAAGTRGPTNTFLGLYAIEDLQRVYRLEPRQMMEVTIRVDQGRLADLLESDPGGTYAIDVTVITAPRVLSATEFSTGVGGQAVGLGEFTRGGLSSSAPADFQHIAADAQGLTGDRQMIRIQAAGALLRKADHPELAAALAAVAKGGDPLARAAVLRALPYGVAGDAAGGELVRVLNVLADDADPLVRLMWVRRQCLLANAGGPDAQNARALLEKLAPGEKDPRVKTWLDTALPLIKAAADGTAGK